MASDVGAFAASRFFNRVLGDYPAARKQLAVHVGKSVLLRAGPIEVWLRVDERGGLERVGEPRPDQPYLTVHLPARLMARQALQDHSPLDAVTFSGDSELASTFDLMLRHARWDAEEDLSQIIGPVAAHRVADSAKRLLDWQRDSKQRLVQNLAEYLTEERRSFISRADLESLTRGNETLRDDLARLEARIARIDSQSPSKAS